MKPVLFVYHRAGDEYCEGVYVRKTVSAWPVDRLLLATEDVAQGLVFAKRRATLWVRKVKSGKEVRDGYPHQLISEQVRYQERRVREWERRTARGEFGVSKLSLLKLVS
jgi:hypothetical protein